MDVLDSDPPQIDVTYAAHGSPYYDAARLDGVVAANMDDISSALGDDVSVGMSPVDMCTAEVCFDEACTTERVIAPTPIAINTNQTSFAGLNVTYM